MQKHTIFHPFSWRPLRVGGLLWVCLIGSPASADIIDRVLAVVGSRVIMLSDVRAVTELGVMEIGPTDDPEAEALSRLIDRTVVLTEANRFLVPEPESATIAARVEAVRTRHATVDAFQAAMAAVGMTDGRLRRFVRDDLRIESYLRQRFTAAARPTDAEAARHYREHEAEYRRDDRTLPFDEVREVARADLLEQRRQQLIAAWIERVRSSVVVTRLDRP